MLATYGSRAQRVPNAYGSTADVVLPTGAGQVVRFEFDQDKRVRVVHAGDEDHALLAEGCH